MTPLSLISMFGCLLLASCADAPPARRVILRSQRTPVSVSAIPPIGWAGPGYAKWPSYDSWSFGRGDDPHVSYLEVRFDPICDGSTRIGQTTPAEIVESLKDTFVNPQVEEIATITLAGSQVFVHAIHNVAGEQYATAVRYGDTQISVNLDAPDRSQLDRYRKTFLKFLHHLQVRSN